MINVSFGLHTSLQHTSKMKPQFAIDLILIPFLQEQLEKAEKASGKIKANSIWKDICDTSEEITQTEKRIEKNGQKRSNIKIVSCIGDIVQGSTMMILMLRSDLRIRGLLGLTKAANNIGMDPSK